MQEPGTDRITNFYSSVALLELEGEQKSSTAKRIIDDLEVSGDYWIQMILAAIIAALGLLINSTPVVIGAMLIAPILRPIQAASFGIASGNKKLILKSFGVLIMSILVGVAASYLVTLAIPLTQLTEEILIRTEPTLIDLAIALASGVVGFLVFGYEKITDSIAGVAVAASLVPPLSVIGVGLALANGAVAQGSFVLFMTNLIAIIFVGIIIFYLFGFYPNQKKELRRSVLNLIGVIGIMVALSVPLASTLISLVQDARIQTTSEGIINEYIHDVTPETVIQQLSVSPTSEDLAIDLVLQSPENAQLDQLQKEELTRLLAEEFSSDIRLQIRALAYTDVRKEELIIVDPYANIESSIDAFLASVYPQASLLTYRLIDHDSTTLLAEVISDSSLNTTRFERALLDYLISEGMSINTLITSITVLDSSEDSNDDRQTTLDAIQTSIERSIIDTYIQDVRIDTGIDQTLSLTVVGVTTLPAVVFAPAFTARQEQNSALIPEGAIVRAVVQSIEPATPLPTPASTDGIQDSEAVAGPGSETSL